MSRPLAFVSDFDGTITADDFFTLAAVRYFDDAMLAPWRAYQAGEKKHFDALNEMFQQLKNLPDLESFTKSIAIDSCFPETAELCRRKRIPLYICSAGCDWYINLLIGSIIRENHICLVTNHCDYSPKTGLVMARLPQNHPCYDDEIGISKAGVVRQLKEQGFRVVFAGDGKPDILPAREADVVFAKKKLLELCRQEDIPTENFASFADIYRYLKEN